MPNPYVNKVQKSDGTTILDITDTTAVASDVAEGKYFYLATGQKVSGTASGGGSVLVEENENSTGTQLDITATSTVYLQPWFSVTPSASEQQISPASGYDAMSGFTVEAIPSEYVVPTGTFSISSNGTYNVEAFAQAEVSVPSYSLASLNVSENGTYNPSSGYAFDSVVVNVAGTSVDPVDIIATTILSGSISGSATSIVDNAFNGRNMITEASFPSCTIIGGSAFRECHGLTNVSFPLCTWVGAYAFSWCYRISSVYFPVCEYIGMSAFYSCSALKTAVFPSCKSMMSGAFMSCRDLSLASFPIYSDTIPSYAFYQCASLTDISFPNATGIFSAAFYGCTSLTSVDFSKCTFVGSSAFYNCKKLSRVSFLTATTVNPYAFASCSSLDTVDMPKLELIHSQAFQNCSKLSMFSAPARIVSTNAFGACYSLGTIILSYSMNSAKNIYGSAFRSCSKLFSLYLLYGSIYTLANVNAFTGTPISVSSEGVYGSVFVPSSLYASYTTGTNWTTYAARIVSLTDTQIQNVITYGTHNP